MNNKFNRPTWAAILAFAALACASVVQAQDVRPTSSTPSEPISNDRQALAPSGSAVTADGTIKKNGTLVSLPVQHAITGVLKYPVKGLGLFVANSILPAGQAVYGVPMVGTNGIMIVWCAPRINDPTKHTYATVCLPQDRQGIYRWITSYPPPYVTSLLFNSNRSAATPPVVDRGPIDLPPMKLSYNFIAWDEKWASVDVKLSTVDGDMRLVRLRAPLLPNGKALLITLAGTYLLKASPEPGGAQVEVITREGPSANAGTSSAH